MIPVALTTTAEDQRVLAWATFLSPSSVARQEVRNHERNVAKMRSCGLILISTKLFSALTRH
jgi:hypothetical protein